MDCRGNRKLTVAENVRLQDSIHRHDFPGIIMSLPILEMFRRRARNRRRKRDVENSVGFATLFALRAGKNPTVDRSGVKDRPRLSHSDHRSQMWTWTLHAPSAGSVGSNPFY